MDDERLRAAYELSSVCGELSAGEMRLLAEFARELVAGRRRQADVSLARLPSDTAGGVN